MPHRIFLFQNYDTQINVVQKFGNDIKFSYICKSWYLNTNSYKIYSTIYFLSDTASYVSLNEQKETLISPIAVNTGI